MCVTSGDWFMYGKCGEWRLEVESSERRLKDLGVQTENALKMLHTIQKEVTSYTHKYSSVL